MIKKESESELIYYQNQINLLESNIIKLTEEIIKLSNEFSVDKKQKDSDLHILVESVNNVQNK